MIPSALAQATLASRFGPIEVAATAQGLVAVAFRTTPEALAADVRRRFARVGKVDDLPSGEEAVGDARRWIGESLKQLREYVDGERRAFDLILDTRALIDWDRRVLEGVAAIRSGQTRGYGEVARAIGSPGAARAAGGAVGRNPLALVIPCHRVIAGDGTLGGYGGSWPGDRDQLLDLKVDLLAHEGVHIERARRAA